jgi:hypothetical protein
MSIEEKTFILGVGAQKAGTTWLASYLGARFEVYIPGLKELHYFNNSWPGEVGGLTNGDFVRRLAAQAAAMQSQDLATRRMALPVLRALLDRLAMIDGGDAAYFAFFRDRIADHHTHFGEVTPDYALLPAEAFRHTARCTPT